MRVLMFSWEFPPHVVGGLGEHVANLVPALGSQGVEVHLITPRWAGGPSEEQNDGYTVHRIDPPTFDAPDVYTSAWQTNLAMEKHAENLWRSAGPFDLIHAHDWLVAFAPVALKRSLKTPLVATIHATERGRSRGHLSTDVQHAINNAEWWLTYEAWRLICASRFMAHEVTSYFQVPGDKIDVIPNGVNAEAFARWQGEDLSAFRAMYALPEEQIVYYVGRLVREKGAGVLVEAAPHVLRECPRAKFVVAGTGLYGDELRSRAALLGVADKILFTGFIPDEDRDRLYCVANCAVFPSLYEPFGIVALQAMAARTPVVVSEVGGLAEVVKHAETGITVYPNNPESLAWGILHTLLRPDWARQRAENAYRVVLEQYNWPVIARKTADLYRRVIEERARAQW
ncbi:MAG: glycosyltransferase family 4 protein [Anaerolineae bacterium]|nr:glycosyltransferase family 4 protein [Anaerolineae bacterium]